MIKTLTPKIQLILLLSFPRMQHLTKILLLFAIILLASCGKQLPDSMSGIIVSKEENGSEVDPTESLKVSAKSLTFLAEGGSNNFTITSNTSWTITSDQSWCTLSPSSGSGNSSISVNVQENTSTQLRSATLSMKADEITQTIPVTQAGANQSSITFTVSGVSFKMIRVDGGTFTMGATSEQGTDASDGEKPTHRVTVSTYYMGETEVTQELWQAVMGICYPFTGSRKPAGSVSWQACQDFIITLNTLTGSHFRLPTEAEWEFAARGGNNSRGYKYAGSNTVGDVAWYQDNCNMAQNVAEKSPNELGLYDMSGNIWEWCQDWYGRYSSSSLTDPTGPSTGSNHACRGGCWNNGWGACRVSSRNWIGPSDSIYNLGLRLAL